MYSNRNKWLVGILALLLTLIIGYALFSENITIDGTLQAQGNFDIQATCTTGFGPELVTVGVVDSVDADQGGYENDVCSVVGDEVVITTDLKYPSATRVFTLYFKNKGTISTEHNLSDIVDNSTLCYQKLDETTETCLNFSDAPAARSFYYSYEPILVKTSDGTILTPDDDLFYEKYYDDDNEIMKLDTNETLIYVVILTWYYDDEIQKKYLNINLDLDFAFKQATN